jgi:hypothetical protein
MVNLAHAGVVDDFVCGDIFGKRIPIIVKQVERYGEAFTANNQKFITIDTDIVQNYSNDAVRFILLHECGHHVLNELEITHRWYQDGEMAKIEHAADCYAAENFRTVYGKYRLISTLDELLPLNTLQRNMDILNCLDN